MPNKTLMLSLAFGIAGLVLILTVLIGGSGHHADDTSTQPIHPDEVFQLPETGGNEQLPLGEAEGLVFEVKEQGILFYANRIVPRSEGEIDAIDTSIRIHLSSDLELIVDADEGTIVAPEQHPREGQMRGNVVVTLYEAPEGVLIDTESDQQVVMRMYFDDPVDFDLELQQIDSQGPVFITGPQVEFVGRGLSLNYNQLKDRIERLVIEHGESLRYIPEPAQSTTTAITAKAGPPAATPPGNPKPKSPQSPTPNPESPLADPSIPPAATRRIHYYFAHFEQLRDVRVGQDQYVLAGDTLSAIFSTSATSESETTQAQRSLTPSSQCLASTDRLSPALAYALAAAPAQLPDIDPRSLATFTDDDVVIMWDGQLVVTPINEQDIPDTFAGPDDVMVTLHGKPVTITTQNHETITAPEVSFFKLSAGLLAKGSTDSPVTLEAPDLGTLTGTEFAVDQLNAKGYVQGPGKLLALVKEDDNASLEHTADTLTSDTRNPKPETQPLTVDFQSRLDLTFYTRKDDTQPANADQTLPVADARIQGIKSADFLGNVHVDDDQLDMTTDRLTLALVEDPPEGDDALAVESLTALGRVTANVKQEDVKLIADRLVAYPAKDELELFGSTEQQARVQRPDATLAGEHMVMNKTAATVTVPGPGSFDYIHDMTEPDNTVHVTWADRMNYDDLAGTARFLGDVKTRAIDDTDTNELMGNNLLLTFTQSDDAAESDQAVQGRQLVEAVMDSNVRFRARSYATDARNDLQTELYLVGEKMIFNDAGTEIDDTAQQVQILGKGRMLITDSRESAHDESKTEDSIDMTGRGRTAFEWSDSLNLNLTQGEMVMQGAVVMVHQPPEGAPGSTGEYVQLDCHDLTAELKPSTESAQMKTSGETTSGRTTSGRTTSGGNTSGGGSWLSDDAAQLQLDRVWADGGIRILTGDLEVTCDHLLYEEDKREIILWSDEPNVVIYQAKDQPTPAKSSAFKWHRDTGRVEAFKLRTGTIPLRRSELK